MGSILGTQSGSYPSVRPRALDTEAQQSGTASAATNSATARAGEGAASEKSAATGAPALDPTQVRSRIDGLIDGHVAAGRLTGDQARVLKQVLGSGGTEAAADAGQPPAGAAPAPAGASADTAAPAADAETEQAEGRQNPSEMLASFIRQLQTVQSRTVGYASDGSSEGAKLTSSRLLDFNT